MDEKQVSCHLTRCSDSLKRQGDLSSPVNVRIGNAPLIGGGERVTGALPGYQSLPIRKRHIHIRVLVELKGRRGTRHLRGPSHQADFGKTLGAAQALTLNGGRQAPPGGYCQSQISVECYRWRTESIAPCLAQLHTQGKGKMPPALALPGRNYSELGGR